MDTYTIPEILAEQPEIALFKFDFEVAYQLGTALRDAAVAAGQGIAIEVSHGDDIVFATLTPGATHDNHFWADRKRAVVRRFHHSSLLARLRAEEGGYNFNQRFRLPVETFAASGGAVPIVVEGVGLVGCVAISGLPDVTDHRLGANALRAIRASQGA